MNIIITVFSTFFVLLALAVLFAFYRTRHYGLLLIGLAYGISAVLALLTMQSWPLVVGFAVAWIMKKMGLEPEVGEPSKRGDQGSVTGER